MNHEIETILLDFNNTDTPSPAKQNVHGASVEQELQHQEPDDQHQRTRE